MTTKRRIRIERDEDAQNPRTEYDNAGRMLCWHGRYNLGDDNEYNRDECLRQLAFEHDAELEEYVDRLEDEVTERLFDRAADNGCDNCDDRYAYANRWVRPRVDEAIEKALSDGYVVLPVYMYDHSGIALSTAPFGCRWDSGQVGWIVCDNETVEKEWGGDREKAENYLRGEVETYSEYVNGDVWFYIAEESKVEDFGTWHETDSCGGFYGYDNCAESAKSELGAEYADAEIVGIFG